MVLPVGQRGDPVAAGGLGGRREGDFQLGAGRRLARMGIAGGREGEGKREEGGSGETIRPQSTPRVISYAILDWKKLTRYWGVRELGNRQQRGGA